jgi:hypothetical protein
MFCHSTNTASFFSILMAAFIFSLSVAGIAAAQGNTRLGTGALQKNTTGQYNTSIGDQALYSNTRGNNNTAIGAFANMIVANLTNATAIGAGAIVNADNNIRLGNTAVTSIPPRNLQVC